MGEETPYENWLGPEFTASHVFGPEFNEIKGKDKLFRIGCPHCLRYFDNSEELNTHIKQVHPDAFVTCECGEQFRFPSELYRHIKQVHSYKSQEAPPRYSIKFTPITAKKKIKPPNQISVKKQTSFVTVADFVIKQGIKIQTHTSGRGKKVELSSQLVRPSCFGNKFTDSRCRHCLSKNECSSTIALCRSTRNTPWIPPRSSRRRYRL